MQPGYRKADMIELHDAGIVIHTEDVGDDGLGWRDSPTVAGRRFAVDGNEIARLLQALGVTFDAEALYGDEFDVLFRRPMKIGESKPDVPLEDVLRIQELRARPKDPSMLHIHITTKLGETDDDQYVQELTYSGRYTVWWSSTQE